MARTLLIFFLLLFSFKSYADSPPCWCPFEEESANKKFIAIVSSTDRDSLVDPWNSTWTITVYQKSGKEKRLLWQMKYDYTGYPGGLLSDDGQTFTYIEYWYYANSPQIDVYRKGKKVNTLALVGKNFRIAEEKLVQTVSHQLWLKEEGRAYMYYRGKDNRLLLKVYTIDGKTHFVDLHNGRLIK